MIKKFLAAGIIAAVLVIGLGLIAEAHPDKEEKAAKLSEKIKKLDLDDTDLPDVEKTGPQPNPSLFIGPRGQTRIISGIIVGSSVTTPSPTPSPTPTPTPTVSPTPTPGGSPSPTPSPTPTPTPTPSPTATATPTITAGSITVEVWKMRFTVNVTGARMVPDNAATALAVGNRVSVKGTMNSDTGIVNASIVHDLTARTDKSSEVRKKMCELIERLIEMQRRLNLPLTPSC